MYIKKEKIIYGIHLGERLSRLEWIWGGDHDPMGTVLAKREIVSIVSADKLSPNESDYDSFAGDIVYYYQRNDIEVFYCMMIGYCFQRASLLGHSDIKEHNDELRRLAKSMLDIVPEEMIGDKDKFFGFVTQNKKSNIRDFTNLVIKWIQDRDTEEKSAYVFISYSSKNSETATAVRDVLIQEKIPVWMAPDSIPAGQKYAHVIENALQDCSCLLLLLSEQSQNSTFVEKEVERALSHKKPVITMLIDDVELNPGFRYYLSTEHMVRANSVDMNDDGFKKVFDAITERVKPVEYVSKRSTLPLKEQVHLFLAEFKSEEFLRAKEYWDAHPDEVIAGGIFLLCAQVFALDDITDEDKALFENTLVVWKCFYKLAKEKGFEDICARMKTITCEEYDRASGRMKTGMTDAMNELNEEFVRSFARVHYEDEASCENADLWRTMVKEMIVMNMLFK